MLRRDIDGDLEAWRASERRLPLILRGARQTGKSYSLMHFGQSRFRQVHVLNFQEDRQLGSLFSGSLAAAKLLQACEFYLNTTIDCAHDLLFLDEIQDCPEAVTSLKFFAEQLPELAVCCAGSLLGVTHAESAFPVGKVTFLDLFPLSFFEFLTAVGDQAGIAILTSLRAGDRLPEAIHVRLLERLRDYLVVGGMPACVELFRSSTTAKVETFAAVRNEQRNLLDAYVRDFAKYADTVSTRRIMQVFEGVPAQLAKESRKFVPSAIQRGTRHATFESAIDWLTGAGLLHRVHITNSGELPFAAFTSANRFKLYFLDCGLLGALAALSPGALVQGHDLFATFKGAFCENFVAQEFIAGGARKLVSWASNTAEVEFLREFDGQVIPVEVKAGRSGKLKSLNVFAQRYRCPYKVRLSARNLELNEDAHLHSYPLYLAARVGKL